MGLIPTRTTTHILEGYEDQSLFTEGNLRTVVTEGWYTHPSLENDMLIEREHTTVNQFGSPLHQTKEEWIYDRPGGPPKQYLKQIWSKVFVPGINTTRSLTLMQQETTVYWTFTPYSPDVLSYRRQVDAYVVYNLKPEPHFEFDDQGKVVLRGMKADGATEDQKRYHIASGKLWNEAANQGTTVEKADANQGARWVEGVIVEEVQVTEETDRYTQWGWRKFALRPDDIEEVGPNYFQKESYNYRLDVPIEPPEISVSNAVEDGVRVKIKGGGATIKIPLTTGAAIYRRGPELYKVFRKTIDEADRTTTDDPHKLWLPGEAPPAVRRSIIVNTFVGSYDGTPDPNNGLPSQTSYTEPDDPEPLIDDDWHSVGTAKNEAKDIDHEMGHGVLFDKDVTSGSTYVYAATAVLQDSESALSNQESIEFDGAEPRRYRISIRRNEDGSIEGDVLITDDPAAAVDTAMGETVPFEIPAYVEELGDWGVALDAVMLTVDETINVEEETFFVTPANTPELWTPESSIRITDIIGPGAPDATGNVAPHRVKGQLVSLDGTTLIATGIGADGHLYPIGSLVELMDSTNDFRYGDGLRLGDETGDAETATMESLILAVGQRQGQRNRDESFTIDVQVKMPLIGLQAGAEVVIRDVEWDAWGNNLWLKSQVEEVPWVLRGWSITVTRDENGSFKCDGTKLILAQR